MTRLVIVAVSLSMLLLLGGCGSTQPSGSAPGTSDTGGAPAPAATPVTLHVFAAASLKTTFTDLARTFEREHPGATVALNFAGSSDLVAQIRQGAPADVFASANETNMTKATDDNLIAGEPAIFARNTLQIVMPAGATAVSSLAGLTAPGLRVVVCAPQVPCGEATKKAADAAGVTLTPVSEESSVTDVLNKVVTGEADAGLVYRTDAVVAGDKVISIDFAEASAAVNRYPIGVIAESPNRELAEAFVSLVTSPAGQKAFEAAGFAAP